MRNNDSNCEKKFNKQMACGFAAYMMAGSLFRKCRCSNSLEARHLYLYYREMSPSWQIAAEDGILQALSKLDQKWLDMAQSLYCEARFHRNRDVYQLWFYTGGFGDLILRLDGSGRLMELRIV